MVCNFFIRSARVFAAAAALLLLGLVAPGAHAQNPFANGSFESSLSGNWTLNGNVAVFTYSQAGGSGLNTAVWGSKAVTFNEESSARNGVLAQNFDTVAGQSYTVTFLYGDYNYNSPSTEAIKAAAYSGGLTATNVAGAPTQGLLSSQTYTDTNTVATTNFTTVYTGSPYTFSFTANSTTTTLAFLDVNTGVNTDNAAGVLDMVTVAPAAPPAVPEPGMVVFGLSTVCIFGGSMLRARKKRNLPAPALTASPASTVSPARRRLPSAVFRVSRRATVFSRARLAALAA